MSFFALVCRNLLRRPARSLLTATGVAVGVAACVMLISLASGFERSFGAVYDASGADLLVDKSTTRRPIPTPFPDSTLDDIRRLPHVAAAAGILAEILSIEAAPAVLVFGWEPGSFLWNHLTLLEGRWPADSDERAVAVGTIAADMLGKSIGDSVQIEAIDYRVCGRFTSASFSENGSVLMSLRQAQAVTGREGMVNFAALRLTREGGRDTADAVRTEVRARFSGFSAETSGEALTRNIAIQAAKAMSLATSLVALLLGAIGITNTVLMNVMERQHEIAVLLALGWRRSRVMRLILGESALLSIAGGLAGAMAGVLALLSLQEAPWFRGKIETDASGWMLAAIVLAASLLGALCGIYPAWRSTRVPVVEGLHRE